MQKLPFFPAVLGAAAIVSRETSFFLSVRYLCSQYTISAEFSGREQPAAIAYLQNAGKDSLIYAN